MVFAFSLGLSAGFSFRPLSAAVQATTAVFSTRQTGMVTFRRRFAGTFSAPFYEFRCHLAIPPGPARQPRLAIWLHHTAMPMGAVSGWQEAVAGQWSWKRRWLLGTTCNAIWDVTQPLPELPLLEQFASRPETPQSTTAKPAVSHAAGCEQSTYRRWSRVAGPTDEAQSRVSLAATAASCKPGDRPEPDSPGF